MTTQHNATYYPEEHLAIKTPGDTRDFFLAETEKARLEYERGAHATELAYRIRTGAHSINISDYTVTTSVDGADSLKILWVLDPWVSGTMISFGDDTSDQSVDEGGVGHTYATAGMYTSVITIPGVNETITIDVHPEAITAEPAPPRIKKKR